MSDSPSIEQSEPPQFEVEKETANGGKVSIIKVLSLLSLFLVIGFVLWFFSNSSERVKGNGYLNEVGSEVSLVADDNATLLFEQGGEEESSVEGGRDVYQKAQEGTEALSQLLEMREQITSIENELKTNNKRLQNLWSVLTKFQSQFVTGSSVQANQLKGVEKRVNAAHMKLDNLSEAMDSVSESMLALSKTSANEESLFPFVVHNVETWAGQPRVVLSDKSSLRTFVKLDVGQCFGKWCLAELSSNEVTFEHAVLGSREVVSL